MKEFVIGFRLNHPNIVRYIDFVNVAGLCNCILMEYVVGTSLDEYLATSPDVATKRSVVLQVADALKAIHAEQIIHRDLKPDNIMVTTNGNRVKIVDFGLSDSDNYAISSVILMQDFERYFKDRMDGPPLSLHCQPALPRTARCQCSGKGGGWACKTQWERDMKTGVRKKVEENVHCIKKYTIFANDRLLRLLTD